MDYSTILTWLNGINPIAHIVLVVLGCLVVLGMAYVKAFPASKETAFILKVEALPVLGPILTALMAFSPIQRKDS